MRATHCAKLVAFTFPEETLLAVQMGGVVDYVAESDTHSAQSRLL